MGMVVVGAGQAGLQLAESLRTEGWDGPLTLIGDEPHPPYHRPPLSKAMLAEGADGDQLIIRGAEVFTRKGIALITGTGVAAIDRDARRVVLDDGRTVPYRGLGLATGARPRPLPVPGAGLDGVLGLRTWDDARRLAAALSQARRVVVIGGGFIGLEVAAAARKRGAAVTVLEAADRLMPRVVTPVLSAFFARLHSDHGVVLRFGARVAALVGQGGRVTAVRTADGDETAADVVVVGVGVLPNSGLARAAGLACCERGILVDGCGRTSDPAIVAAGDCAARRTAAGPLSLESVQNAVELGKAAAAALMGRERPFTAPPWFWSDQYEVKLQMVGLGAGHDRVVVRGGGMAFSAFSFRDGRLLAIDSVNRPQDHMSGRKLLDRGIAITPEQAADPGLALASLL